MRRICTTLSGLALLILLGSCHSAQNKQQSGESDSTVVKMQANISDTLAAKMDAYLQTYFQLKDAFVKTDTVAADEAALHLLENMSTLSLHELQSDSVRYKRAHASLESLDGEILGLLGEKTLLGKRQELQMISGISYDLIKAVGLKEGTTVYRDFCPMFNDGNGAYWLSDRKKISNPFYGDEMPGCGELKETLQF
ncbi:MAG TPA: DUF3347 domain-containing protein [Chitinophagaceae bacterium]|jgi:Cu(I)/Ag(I) efflux system membrane fusion protein|nr:DUF3347 domain-containing protein [Chitinophagaceae bacterium]